MVFSIYFGKNFCEKRNASTPLGIEPRTFQLPVGCSIMWAIGNRKVLGSVPSGVEAFLFTQNFFSKKPYVPWNNRNMIVINAMISLIFQRIKSLDISTVYYLKKVNFYELDNTFRGFWALVELFDLEAQFLFCSSFSGNYFACYYNNKRNTNPLGRLSRE